MSAGGPARGAAAGDVAATARELAAAAHGGRVRSTGFLDPEAADALLGALRDGGTAASAWGGRTGARRRVVTARPDHVPSADAALAAVYFEGAGGPDELRVALRAAGVPGDAIGDAVPHDDGVSVVLLAPPPDAALAPVTVAGRRVVGRVVPLERLEGGRGRSVEAVVRSLRLDALGGRAFGVSRSYFAKGMEAGRVRLNGVRAAPRDEAGIGDEVWAEGLGRFRVVERAGETKRGNVRVRLEVERDG